MAGSERLRQTPTRRRRRIGCQNCRARRIKCDEKIPCGYCTRRKLSCNQTDFIVHNKWSILDAPEHEAADKETSAETTPDTNIPTSHNLESTYEVFQQAQFISQHESRSSPSSPSSVQVTITEEIACLLEIYETGIGTWMDILDHSLTYQRQVLRYALSSSLLLHAICALSAKQMSLIGDSFLWDPVSTRYYGNSLGLLIEELEKQQSTREVVIAATILLCSYELLACPGADYQKHLYGARSLFQTHNIASTGTKLEKASFWIYARQDVSMALVHECTTLISPQEWPTISESEELEEDALGNRILWILAKVIQFKFSDKGSDSQGSNGNLQQLISEIDLWWERFPTSARGVATTEPSEHGLRKIWFCVPSAAAACLYYHLAKILSLECLLERQAVTPLSPASHSTWFEEIHYHALTITSISLSPGLPGGALVVAVNPLFYAARHIDTIANKSKIWALLEDIERRLGFHTQNRVSRLRVQQETILNNG